jgi:outer membrane lipoprotein-sorting protein
LLSSFFIFGQIYHQVMYKKTIAFSIVLIISSTLFIYSSTKVEKLSMSMLTRTLTNGKSINFNSTVYYDQVNGNMVTYFDSPLNNIVTCNPKGDVKIYNSKDNTVMVTNDFENSSENSFIYYFLNKKGNDLGLSQSFKLTKTKTEDNLIITEWTPNVSNSKGIGKVEYVMENQLPIFMGFYSYKGKLIQKIYYGKYQMAGDINIPSQITEIVFDEEKNDSSITQRRYTNIKINSQVDAAKLTFKVPSNAKLVKMSF